MSLGQPYPVEFVHRVEALFPHRQDISLMLQHGSSHVGEFLREQMREGIPFEDVLTAFKGGDNALEALRVRAERLNTVRELHEEWIHIQQAELAMTTSR